MSLREVLVNYFATPLDYTNALIVVLLKMSYSMSAAELDDCSSYYAVDIVINIENYHFHGCYLCCLLHHFDGYRAHYFLNSY